MLHINCETKSYLTLGNKWNSISLSHSGRKKVKPVLYNCNVRIKLSNLYVDDIRAWLRDPSIRSIRYDTQWES